MSQKTELFTFIEEAVSPFHTVKAVEKRLVGAGFERLYFKERWNLKKGGAYYYIHHGTTIFAFTVGVDMQAEDSFRIGASHGDFPGFRIKPNPEIGKNGYLELNTETYGGVNLASWMDRALSAAGRVMVRSGEVFSPREVFVDLQRPIFVIPNIAIHMNREMNEGNKLNRQVHMLPLAGMVESGKEKEAFLSWLAKEIAVDKEDILGFELHIYNKDECALVGMEEEFLLAPRLDNLTSSYALTKAIIEGRRDQGVNMAVVFDHEEIGSRTKQGAGSTLLAAVLEKVYKGAGFSREDFQDAWQEGLLMSVDVAHGYHPNYSEKSDPTNQPRLGGGICIKEACSQSYATDGSAIAIMEQICQKEGIPYQKALNRSDAVGGGTLGAIASAMLPVRTVDLGVPLLAMHSARELMGRKDQESLERYLKNYFSIEK